MSPRVTLLVAGGLLAIAAVTLLRGNDEPRYRGRTLSQRIKASSQAPDEAEPHEAIVIITINFAPVLVRWLSSHHSSRMVARGSSASRAFLISPAWQSAF